MPFIYKNYIDLYGKKNKKKSSRFLSQILKKLVFLNDVK